MQYNTLLKFYLTAQIPLDSCNEPILSNERLGIPSTLYLGNYKNGNKVEGIPLVHITSTDKKPCLACNQGLTNSTIHQDFLASGHH